MNIGMDRFPPVPQFFVSGFGAAPGLAAGRLVVFALLVWSVFLLAPAAAVAQALDAYRLGPGDRLKVTVFDHPRSSGDFELDSLGTIAYPLLGRVEARGKTIAELQEFLRSELDKKYIVNPRVSIEVLNYRPFYIYGEVNRAGSYPYVIGLTVRRAVAIAGGFTRRAREGSAELVREGTDGTIKLIKNIDDNVLPGDIVKVERRLF
tara:strand:- start:1212 stop:1829 length:618 start_codon:yes stop_codon:yes gene_type:complete